MRLEVSKKMAMSDKERLQRAGNDDPRTRGMHTSSPGKQQNSGQRESVFDPRSNVGDLSGGESAGRVGPSSPMSDRGDVYHVGQSPAPKRGAGSNVNTPAHRGSGFDGRKDESR